MGVTTNDQSAAMVDDIIFRPGASQISGGYDFHATIGPIAPPQIGRLADPRTSSGYEFTSIHRIAGRRYASHKIDEYLIQKCHRLWGLFATGLK